MDKSRPSGTTMTTLSQIEIPALEPPTAEEIARRRAHYEKVMALREQMPPLGMSSAELIHLARAEPDGDDA